MRGLRLSIAVLVSLLSSSWLAAAEDAKPKAASPEFERLKTLVGKWQGKADMGQGQEEFTVEYRLTSGGNAVEERLFAGSPKEMVTMYYVQQGKLALTHFCMLPNRPRMLLGSSDAKTLKFDFDSACDIAVPTETHMHALTITFDGPDTITQDWQLFAEGKASGQHRFTFQRVKG